MKPALEHDPSLREFGKFVFVVDDPPTRPFVVKADGRAVWPRSDGRYVLEERPRVLDIERCAGPFYTPPIAWFLQKQAVLKERREFF